MTEHIHTGDEILFYQWNNGNSNHDEFRAIIRAVVAGGSNPEHPNVNISYIDSGAQNANNIRNIEDFGSSSNLTGNDYWRRSIVAPNVWQSRPFRSTREGALAGIVWLGIWNATTSQHDFINAVVITLLGPGSNQDPKINCFYGNESGNRETLNNVTAFDAITGDSEDWEDYFWADRILQGGDDDGDDD